MRKVLYIEDMEKCHELTRQALGDDYKVTSAYTPNEAESIIRRDIQNFDALISDVNLIYDPEKSDSEQTTEGLELIALARNESKQSLSKFPIICISSRGDHRTPALKNGANIFLWKKAFWNGKGKQYLDKILDFRDRKYGR